MPFAKLADVTLNYRFDGPAAAPVVMLCNSLSSNLSMWDAQVPALVDAGFRVLRYDTRGHGSSSVANWLPISEVGMKWPLRAAMRAVTSSGVPRSQTKRTSGEPPARMSR